jgi:uncharacterized protein (TIGR02246 family)
MIETASEDERAIRALVGTWMAATKAGDLATVLNLMSDDVMFITVGREPFGKEEFRTAAESMRDLAIDGRAEIREIEVLGDRAWTCNFIEIVVTPSRGEHVRRSGHTLTIFKKGEDGRWRLFRDANFVN